MNVAESLKQRGHEAPERPPFYVSSAFWRGFASAFNVWGDFRPKYHGRDPEQADYEALCSDWEAVGRDMEITLRRFEAEHAEEIRRAYQQRLFDPRGLEKGR